ncbi:MAG: hypothetical protein ABR551_01585 [Gemmatimonadales bacterium]
MLPTDHPPRPDSPRFGYFLLQAVSAPDPRGFRVALMLEDLGTGEKHRFESGAALGSFLDSWRTTPDARRSP